VLTTFGSSYYHFAPDNSRLVWDRLPMTLGFMGLLTAILAERVSVRLARQLLGPLLTLGAASVSYWYWTELQHAGDLRFYLLVQFGSLILVLLRLALYPARYAGTGYLASGLALYAAAKGLETADTRILCARASCEWSHSQAPCGSRGSGVPRRNAPSAAYGPWGSKERRFYGLKGVPDEKSHRCRARGPGHTRPIGAQSQHPSHRPPAVPRARAGPRTDWGTNAGASPLVRFAQHDSTPLP
jgi:hypothetical protein